MGDPHQPRRAEVDRPAADDPGGDGEADARRARPPRRDPHRRGRQAVADPHRRGREAGGGAARRGRSGRRRSCAPRARRRRSRRSSARSTRASPTSELLSYQYLQMLPQLAAGRREQGLRHPVASSRRRSAASARRSRGKARRAPPAAASRRTPPSLRTRRPRQRRLRSLIWPMFDSLAEKLQATLADVRAPRHADRGGRRRGDARDPPRAARGRRQLQGRQAVHRRGQGALPRRRRRSAS